MKKIFLALVAAQFLVFACSDDNNKTDQVNQDTIPKLDTVVKVHPLNGYSDHFKAIIKTDSGIIRGVSLTSTLQDVLSMEDSAKLQEKKDNYYLYNIQYNFPEVADVTYYFSKDKKVEKIELDVYPDNKTNQAKLFEEFEKYFTEKYGKPLKRDNNNIEWNNNPDKIQVLLEKKDNQHVHDIILEIGPSKSSGAVSTLR